MEITPTNINISIVKDPYNSGMNSLSLFSEDDTQTLVKLGLTHAQAKIYLTILTIGPSDVKKIAQSTEIDRGEVYRQIETLQKKDLLEKIIDTPCRFKSINLDEAVKGLIQLKKRENADIDQKVKRLLKKGLKQEQLTFDDFRISIIPSDYSKRQLPKRYEYLQKEEVWYTQIENVPFCLNLWDKTFKKAFKKGIKLRAIAEINQPTKTIIEQIQRYAEENPNFIIRFDNPTLFITFAIYDEKEMTMYIERQKGFGEHLKRPVLWTNNPILIQIFKDYFELRWKAAKTEANF